MLLCPYEFESVSERGFGLGVHYLRGFSHVLRRAACGAGAKRIDSNCRTLAPRAFRHRDGIPLLLPAGPAVYGRAHGGGERILSENRRCICPNHLCIPRASISLSASRNTGRKTHERNIVCTSEYFGTFAREGGAGRNVLCYGSTSDRRQRGGALRRRTNRA